MKQYMLVKIKPLVPKRTYYDFLLQVSTWGILSFFRCEQFD